MKTYAYRFMLNCEPPGTLQEGFFEAHPLHHATRKAQKICRDECLSEETIESGKWTRWEQRGQVYGCSLLDTRTGRYGFRLMLREVPDGIPADTASDDRPPTPIHRLLPSW